ncbi:hypothetical protein BDK51DRAFT_25777 [Blyttiomyces helicus]|uniref:Uncharacterized protein n=1 Tax=Blyttiomyces helicus TaxID=388810 RepID=A0A4P9WDC6_9FUNG|nr:hypothetical protein BDK51DRAFT_25777 [Blyttiomyces helicus]|eukprot:RKO90352.1 hypothetical protein BDK51DRAFT_25777 [Blyttiomyces helicus]
MSLAQFPEEIVDHIFEFLPISFALSCRRRAPTRHLFATQCFKPQILRAVDTLDAGAMAFFRANIPGWSLCDPDLLASGGGAIPACRPVEAAALLGRPDALRFLLAVRAGELPPNAVAIALAQGHVNVLDYLVDELALPLPLDAVARAAAHGRADMVRHLLARPGASPPTPAALNLAALGGHLEVVELLAARIGACSPMALRNAAASGHLPVVDFLLPRVGPACAMSDVINVAALNGREAVLVRLLDIAGAASSCSDAAFDAAAGNGHTGILRYLLCRGHRATPRAMELAACGGHLDTIKFLVPGASSCGVRRALAMAEELVEEGDTGYTAVVEYLREFA